MFERWAGRKMALHQLIRGYKSGSDLSGMRSNSGQHFLFCFAYCVRLHCPDVHIKERGIMLKACSFTSHENVSSRYCCTCAPPERQSD